MVDETLPTGLHAAALAYAKAGIPVFPCHPQTKIPVWKGGWASGTTDLSKINEVWSANPEFNIGTNPEAAPWGPSHVVDLDDKDGKEGSKEWVMLCAEHGGDRPTWTVRTSSGGKHRWYKGSLRDTVGKLAEGIDTRGQKGLVLLPPSIGANGVAYEVVDDSAVASGLSWVAEKVGQRNDGAWEAPDGVVLDDEASVAWYRELLAEDVELNGEPEQGHGSDQRCYNLVGVARDGDRRGYSLSPEAICEALQDVWAPHFDFDWLWGKAKRALDPNEYTNEAGCGPAGSAERYGVLPGTGQEIFGAAVEALGIEPNPVQAIPGFRRASDLRGMEFEPTRWVWEGRIVANKPNLLTGDGGAGKTTLAENLAVAVAGGIECLGAATMACNVVLLLGEDGYQRIDANLEALRQHMGLGPEVLDRIYVFSGEDETLPQGAPWLVQINDDGTQIVDSPLMREVIAPLLSSLDGHTLFVIDPLIQFAVFNQLADRAVGTLARTWCKDVCRMFDCTLLINDHPSTSGMEKGRHYAGSKEMRNAFPNFSTLIATEWQNKGLARQKKLTLKGMRNRYGIEETVEIYRNSNDGAILKLHALPGHSPEDYARRVYEHVIERYDRGELTGRDARAAYGSAHIAAALALDPQEVKIGLQLCVGKHQWLVYREAADRTPGHFEPGPVTPLKTNDPTEY